MLGLVTSHECATEKLANRPSQAGSQVRKPGLSTTYFQQHLSFLTQQGKAVALIGAWTTLPPLPMSLCIIIIVLL